MATVRLFRDEVDDLAPVCMRCGAPSTAIRAKTFQWHPSWIALLLLAGLLPYVVVALVLTKRMRVEAPLCDAHKNHWLWRNVIVFGSLLLLGAAFVGGLIVLSALADQRGGQDDPFGYFCVGMAVLGVVWLIVAVVAQQTAIRTTEITDDTITLAGVSPDFRHALKEMESDEEEDLPRRPGRPGHFRESRPPDRPLPPDSYREAEE